MPLSHTRFDARRIGTNTYEYDWASTAGQSVSSTYGEQSRFDIIQDGQIVPRRDEQRENQTRYIAYSTDSLEPPAIEVIVSNSSFATIEEFDDTLQAYYPPIATLQWRGSSDAAMYRIEENLSTGWTHRDIISETNRGYYQYTSSVLSDSTAHEFRVIPRDANGDEGNPLNYDIFMVRNPDPPKIDISYSSSATEFTVSAR